MRWAFVGLVFGIALLTFLIVLTEYESVTFAKSTGKKIANINMIDMYPVFSKSLFKEETRRRRRYGHLKFEEFLEHFAVAFRNDLAVIFVSTLIAIAFGTVIPIFFNKNSIFIGYWITFIPVFLILSLVMYFFNAEWMIYSLFIGILSSARLLTVLSTKISEVEKDDYVIFSLLGGNRRFEITARYTYPQITESIFSAYFWTFVTVVGLVVSIPFLGLSNFMIPSSGLFLFEIYKRPSSTTRLVESLVIVLTIMLLVFAVYLIFRSLSAIITGKLGVRFDSKRSKKRRNIRKKVGEFEGVVVKNLRIRSKAFGITLVDQRKPVIFTPNDKVFVMGPSGSGKTIFTGAILGMIHDHVLEYEGKVLLRFSDSNIDILEESVPDGLTFEYIPQNPRSSFDKYTPVEVQLNDLDLYDDVMKTLKELFGEGYYKEVAKSVKHPPSEINDGTLQILNFIVAVERIKRSDKGVVLFDEPIASLARKNVSKIISLLRREVFKDGILVFWIGHEINMLNELPFNKILIARVDENGVTKFELKDSTEKEEVLSEFEDYRKNITTKLREYPVFEKGSLYEIDLKELVFDKFHKLEYNLKDKINRGKVVLIEGDNGSGKSSLLKALVGYYRKFVKGEIFYLKDGKRLDVTKDFKKIWKYMDVVFQNPESALPKFARVEDLLPGDGNLKGIVLKNLKLSEHREKRIYQLSYGQKKRVMLARSILKDPEVLFLDEPTASLDYANILSVVDEVLKFKIQSDDRTVFFITHDPVFDVLKNKEGIKRITLG